MGKSKEEITAALKSQGWQNEDIEHGFTSTASGIPLPLNQDLPKAGEIFKEAWGIYKARFKTLIAINLIPIASMLSLAVIFGIYFGVKISNIGGQTGQAIIFAILAILFIAAIIFIIYISVWSTVAQIVAIKYHTELIGWKESYKRSRNKINQFFSTNLLAGLAVGGVAVLGVLTFVALLLLKNSIGLPVSFIVGALLAIAVIVAIVNLSLKLSQTSYVVVEDDLANIAALKRSSYYVKKRLGKVFGKLFYLGIITFGLYIGLVVVLGIFNALTHTDPNFTNWITNVFSFIWTPMTIAYGYLLYKHLKATRP